MRQLHNILLYYLTYYIYKGFLNDTNIYNHLLNYLITWWTTKKIFHSVRRWSLEGSERTSKCQFHIGIEYFQRKTFMRMFAFKDKYNEYLNSRAWDKEKAKDSISHLISTWCMLIIMIYLVRTLYNYILRFII